LVKRKRKSSDTKSKMAIKYNVELWITENEKFFLPPVCNKMMHNTQLKVKLVFSLDSC